MLQLALISKQSHGKILPLLYENLTFDHRDYPEKLEQLDVTEPESPESEPELFESSLGLPWYGSNSPQMQSEPPDPEAPFTNIMRLARMLESSRLPFGQNITSLTLKFRANNECNFCQTTLLQLLPHLSSLRHLSLISPPTTLTVLHETFSFAPLAGALRPVSGILRSLSLYISRDEVGLLNHDDGWTIGSLRHFWALEDLSIQVQGLLGVREDVIANADLNEILPSRLKHLRLHWANLHGLQTLNGVLARYVSGLRVPLRLEKITVQVDEDFLRRDGEPGETLVDMFRTDIMKVNEHAMQRDLDIDMKVVVSREYF